jgi:hypothetical protein
LHIQVVESIIVRGTLGFIVQYVPLCSIATGIPHLYGMMAERYRCRAINLLKFLFVPGRFKSCLFIILFVLTSEEVILVCQKFVHVGVRLSPRLWTHLSTDLDETLEIDLENYHTTFSKSKKQFEHFYVFITVPLLFLFDLFRCMMLPKYIII